MTIIGERLRGLRQGVMLSQTKVARLSGATQSSINRYENNVANPTIKVLLWYADYFDVSLDYILGRTEKPEGKLYKYMPKIENNEEMRMFVEMCFDPNSPMSAKLKNTLLQMMNGGDDK